MAAVIDANMITFADRMGISSHRMVSDYGLKTVEEIIDAEVARGNTKAATYAIDLYNSPDKLINVFRLHNVENKYVLLKHMDDNARRRVLPYLDKHDLVMGLYFYTQDKLLEMLNNVHIFELVNVIRGAFPLAEIVQKFKDEDLALFFQSDKLEKHDVIAQLQCMPPDILMAFTESVTGQPASEKSPFELISQIGELPDDQYRDFMSSIDPNVQRQLVFQLTQEKPKYLQLFRNEAYTDMLSTLMKQEMVKPMVNLEKDTLVGMLMFLPVV